MKQDTLRTLLTQLDDTAAEEIALHYPAPFDAERLFRRSLDKSEGRERPRLHRRVWKAAALAACLLLVVGTGVTMLPRMTRLDTRPPQEPSTPAISVETDTSTAPTTAPETTEAPCQIETSAQEAAPEASTLTEPAPETTAALPAVTPTDAPEPISTTAQQIVETPPPETSAVTQPPAEPVTEPTTEPVTEPATEPTKETPVLADEQIAGFRVEQYADYRRVVCTDVFPAPNGMLAPYTVEDARFSLLSVTEERAERTYEVADGDKVFTVTQREYESFALTVEEGELIDISVSRAHGFFLLREEECALYWFRDGEGFYVSGDASDLAALLKIARSFTPTED